MQNSLNFLLLALKSSTNQGPTDDDEKIITISGDLVGDIIVHYWGMNICFGRPQIIILFVATLVPSSVSGFGNKQLILYEFLFRSSTAF